MTLEAIYFIAQILAAIAIVSSLVFVGLQVRANTREHRVTTNNVRTEKVAEIQRLVATDGVLRDILIKSNASYDELTASELMALGAYWQQWCMYFIDVRTQHDLGVISAPIWDNYAFTFRRVCASPGARRWWREDGSRQYSSYPREVLDSIFSPRS